MAARKSCLVGDYVEDYEVMVVSGAANVGHTSMQYVRTRKMGRQLRTAVHDFEGDQTTVKTGHNTATTFEEVEAEAYDALVIPGGRAPEYIRLNQKC